MEKWAAQELQYADLGDTRRKKRLISIVENLASQPSTSVPQASGNLAASIVAWRLLWLTYQARLHGEESCESFLEEHEWQSLCATIHKKSPPPEKPPSLARSGQNDCFSWGFFR